MRNRLLEFAERKENQARIAKKLGLMGARLKEMTDEEIRYHNIAQQTSPFKIEIKQEITFQDVYSFAVEYSKNNMFDNILDEPIDEEGHTLLWSGGTLEDLIKNRKMTKVQYKCCEKVADMMLSGNYDNYLSVTNSKNS